MRANCFLNQKNIVDFLCELHKLTSKNEGTIDGRKVISFFRKRAKQSGFGEVSNQWIAGKLTWMRNYDFIKPVGVNTQSIVNSEGWKLTSKSIHRLQEHGKVKKVFRLETENEQLTKEVKQLKEEKQALLRKLDAISKLATN